MTRRAPARPHDAGAYGPSRGDPLAARLFPPLPGEVEWGLGRTERTLAALGDPHRSYPVLHVGGTNGKGTVARVWAEVLKAAGFRVGLLTSPHFLSFRERILVDGRPLPDELLEEWARDLRPLLLREPPSFFEASIALGFLALARAEVDVAVVEVGMGGRLDATNVVSPVITAITSIAADHQEHLGADLREIAREKAKIMKPGVPAFTGVREPETFAVLAREALEVGAPLTQVTSPPCRTSLDGTRLSLETRRWGPLELASPLVGRHQAGNLALAVRALEALPPRLPLRSGAVREGVLRARLPGRFQVEKEGERSWILDVAHNPAAAAALAATLREVSPPSPLVGVVGTLNDKDITGILSELRPVLDELILTTPPDAPATRRWDASRLTEVLGESGAPESRLPQGLLGFPEALERARELTEEGGTILATGSFYTVGEALRRLDRIPREALPLPSDFG